MLFALPGLFVAGTNMRVIRICLALEVRSLIDKVFFRGRGSGEESTVAYVCILCPRRKVRGSAHECYIMSTPNSRLARYRTRLR